MKGDEAESSAGGGRFEGRVGLITGGANGIGSATAVRLAAEGGQVAIVDLDEDAASALLAELPDGSAFIRADVADPAAITTAVRSCLGRFGRLDQLVNCAGTFTPHGVLTTTPEDWDRVLAVNLRSQMLFIQECAPALVASRGAVVNISSLEAHILQVGGEEATASYAASKAGVTMMSKSAAYDLGASGVRVNVVAPGFVRTGFGGDPRLFEQDPADHERFRRILVRRWGEPEDVAAAIVFLLSDDASYITGTTLVVDGGWSVQ